MAGDGHQEHGLVILLRGCVENGPESGAWEIFHRQITRIIDPIIRARIKADSASMVSQRSSPAEVEDLRQMVWLRLVDRDHRSLHQFKGDNDQAFKYYLFRITITVIQDYLKKPGMKIIGLIVHSLDDLPSSVSNASRLAYSSEEQWQASILIDQFRYRLRSRTSAHHAARHLRIFDLWREGFSLAEISRTPGVGITQQAVGKIIAQQLEAFRRSLNVRLLLSCRGAIPPNNGDPPPTARRLRPLWVTHGTILPWGAHTDCPYILLYRMFAKISWFAIVFWGWDYLYLSFIDHCMIRSTAVKIWKMGARL